jgi:hypothetical protein
MAVVLKKTVMKNVVVTTLNNGKYVEGKVCGLEFVDKKPSKYLVKYANMTVAYDVETFQLIMHSMYSLLATMCEAIGLRYMFSKYEDEFGFEYLEYMMPIGRSFNIHNRYNHTKSWPISLNLMAPHGIRITTQNITFEENQPWMEIPHAFVAANGRDGNSMFCDVHFSPVQIFSGDSQVYQFKQQQDRASKPKHSFISGEMCMLSETKPSGDPIECEQRNVVEEKPKQTKRKSPETGPEYESEDDYVPRESFDEDYVPSPTEDSASSPTEDNASSEDDFLHDTDDEVEVVPRKYQRSIPDSEAETDEETEDPPNLKVTIRVSEGQALALPPSATFSDWAPYLDAFIEKIIDSAQFERAAEKILLSMGQESFRLTVLECLSKCSDERYIPPTILLMKLAKRKFHQITTIQTLLRRLPLPVAKRFVDELNLNYRADELGITGPPLKQLTRANKWLKAGIIREACYHIFVLNTLSALEGTVVERLTVCKECLGASLIEQRLYDDFLKKWLPFCFE